MLGVATSTAVVPFTALCAWLAVRRHPGAWLLDQIATAPLVFPAIVMSVAFLHVFVNLPIPLYGTLHLGHHRLGGALSALRHALRLCGRAADPHRSRRRRDHRRRRRAPPCSCASCSR